MKRSIQHEPLVIQQVDLDHRSFSAHLQNHYELILILAGSGFHNVNGNVIPYQAGDVFFLGPEDSHSFVVHQRTSLYTVSFTMLYLASLFTTGSSAWMHLEKHTARTPAPLWGSRAHDQQTQRSLTALVEMMLAEQQGAGFLVANPIVESVMKTIFGLVDRQLAQHSADLALSPTALAPLIQRMVRYICQHITEPDLLRIDKMAAVFNYSPSHLAALFKQIAGESIQQYIIRYKLKLVETRLSLSTMSISQIADEFGFADVCHLNKLFKRYYHHTPSTYRREAALALE